MSAASIATLLISACGTASSVSEMPSATDAESRADSDVPSPSPPGSAADDAGTTPSLFDDSLVHEVTIDFEEVAYEAMIETYRSTGAKDWIEATVTVDGQTYERAGIRLKGNSSLRGLVDGSGRGSPSADDPGSLPWLIDLDQFVDAVAGRIVLHRHRRLIAHARSLLALEETVILGGDFNVCPTDDDVYDPQGFAEDALCRPESRFRFRTICHLGYTDALRALHPESGLYTYWDYQGGRWNRDEGLRIDHLLLSPQAADRLVGSGVDRKPRGREKPSDHTPVWCELV
jgi:hypothetical protein